MKAHDRETLEWKLDEFDIEGCLNSENTLTIDTSKQDAKISAKQIIEYFKLV